MDGVIILDTLKVFERSVNSFSMGFGTVLIFIGLGVLFYTLSQMSQIYFKSARVIVFAILFGLLTATGTVMCYTSDNSGYEKTQYQVLLTEDVNIAEFREKYKIVGEQGITYIVEERTEEIE